MGSIAMFISPDTASNVRARVAEQQSERAERKRAGQASRPGSRRGFR